MGDDGRAGGDAAGQGIPHPGRGPAGGGRETSDWPWGEHVPFLDDHIIPGARKQLVERTDDLDALRHLLVPPTTEEITIYQQESQPYLELAREHGLLVSWRLGRGGGHGWLDLRA